MSSETGPYLLPRHTFIVDFPKASLVAQQSIARTLGTLAYRQHPQRVVSVIECLLSAVDRKVGKRGWDISRVVVEAYSEQSASFCLNIEARQNAYDALPKIVTELGPTLSASECGSAVPVP